MSIIIRPAVLSDINEIIPLIKLASGGLTEFLLNDILVDVSEENFIEMALTDENTTFHYSNIMVAESSRMIIGASNYYPAELHGLPDVMHSFIDQDKLNILQPYFTSHIEGSIYINTLAVLPEHRNTTCGLILGKKIEQIAKTQKKRCLSAHVWKGNKALYYAMKMAGFKEIEHLDISHPSLTYDGGMALLKGPDFKF